MSTQTSRRYGGRSLDERRAQRRELFLRAGLELYGTVGYAPASIERLCEVAGLSTRQFYEEFGNRNELLVELFDQVQDRAIRAVEAAVREALDEGVDFRELLRRGTGAYAAEIATDPRWARIAYVTVVGVSPEIEAHRQERRTEWADLLTELAQESAARGQIPPRDVRLTMRGYVGAVSELVHLWCESDPRPEMSQILDTLVHLLDSALTRPLDESTP